MLFTFSAFSLSLRVFFFEFNTAVMKEWNKEKVRVRDLSDEHTLMGQKRERPQGLFSNARKHSIYVCTTGWAWDWARYAFPLRLEPKIETSGRNQKWNSIGCSFCACPETEPLPMYPKSMHAIYPLNQDFLLHRLPKNASGFRGRTRSASDSGRLWRGLWFSFRRKLTVSKKSLMLFLTSKFTPSKFLSCYQSREWGTIKLNF